MTTLSLPLDFKRLEQLYAAGLQDNFLENALRKLVARQIERDEADLAQLNEWVADYESKYSMKSEEFWNKYKAGNMADTTDFMEGNALSKSRLRLLDRLKISNRT